ncbi:MAG: hypothetical protein CMM49_05965 [Rhodospirillaceae bacterium]|nr:hypothetical protein [Rhodospirillaceae bacterium]|tara:strand:- start:371 stop:2119 length:1749 start_codon:yes stop_codon:yes gene_type:complete
MKIQNSKFIILYKKEINKYYFILDSILPKNLKEIDNNFSLSIGNAYLDNKVIDRIWLVNKIKLNQYEDIEELNGSFSFIFFNHKGELTVITDRFLSKKIYFIENHKYTILSNNLVNISKFALKEKIISFGNINKNAIFEFLNFRRLYGSKTFFNNISLLKPASIYQINRNFTSKVNFWIPRYDNFISFDEAYITLAENLVKSTSRFINEYDSSSLLLSGGLDSRALLSASKPKFCITVCPSKNNEADIAEILAKKADVPFKFILSKDKVFDNILDQIVCETDGEYSLVNTSFYRYKDEFQKLSKQFMLGLFLDVLFGGLYLPKSKLKLYGVDTTVNILDKIKDNPADYFINNVKYRMKNYNMNTIIKSEYVSSLYSVMHDEIKEHFLVAAEGTNNIYSQWESLHLSPMSRHYSYAMVKSIESFSPCAIPAFDNNLLNLSIKMHPKHKLNSSVYKKAIKYLNPKLMDVLNANSNTRADHNEYISTLLIFSKKIFRKMFKIDLKLPPRGSDRSWLSPSKLIEKNFSIRQEILDLKNSNIFDDLDIIDNMKIKDLIYEHFNNQKDHSILLLHLLTINIFFRNIFK